MSRGIRSEYLEVQQELLPLARVGAALWPDPTLSEKALIETMMAVLMLDRGPSHRWVEKLSASLLARAQKEGVRAVAELASQPFYRLQPEERLVLMGLHRNRWSYARLAQVLSVSVEKIQELAWSSRLLLVYSPSGHGITKGPVGPLSQGLLHPGGPSPGARGQCPEFHPARPWTQRFLDEEVRAQEKTFLQAHLQSCDACARTLARSRAIYYAAEQVLPSEQSQGAELQEKLETLGSTLKQIVHFKYPAERDLRELVIGFFRRSEVQFTLGVLGLLWVYQILRS